MISLYTKLINLGNKRHVDIFKIKFGLRLLVFDTAAYT